MIFSSVFLTHSSDFFLSSKWDSSERTYNETLFRNLSNRSPVSVFSILENRIYYALPLILPSYILRVQSFAKAVPSMRQYTHTSSRLNCSRLSQTYPLKKMMICKIIIIIQKYSKEHSYKMHKYVLVKFTCLMGNDNLCIVRNCFFTCWTT